MTVLIALAGIAVVLAFFTILEWVGMGIRDRWQQTNLSGPATAALAFLAVLAYVAVVELVT